MVPIHAPTPNRSLPRSPLQPLFQIGRVTSAVDRSTRTTCVPHVLRTCFGHGRTHSASHIRPSSEAGHDTAAASVEETGSEVGTVDQEDSQEEVLEVETGSGAAVV